MEMEDIDLTKDEQVTAAESSGKHTRLLGETLRRVKFIF